LGAKKDHYAEQGFHKSTTADPKGEKKGSKDLFRTKKNDPARVFLTRGNYGQCRKIPSVEVANHLQGGEAGIASAGQSEEHERQVTGGRK